MWQVKVLIFGATLLYFLLTGSAARYLLAPDTAAPSGSAGTQELALLAFAAAFENFQSVSEANKFNGWAPEGSPACDPAAQNQSVTSDPAECDPNNQVHRSADCNLWTGVTCNATGQVVCLNLPSVKIKGPINALASLQGLPGLAYVNLYDNKLEGALPPDLGSQLPALQILQLASTELNSTLPSEWGSDASWPRLQTLELQDNALYGTLPETWGRPGAWDSLQELNMSQNKLQGSIPDGWSTNGSSWPSLQGAWLEPGNDGLCGGVPEGFPALQATGIYITGPTYEALTSFSQSCDSNGNPLQPYSIPSSTFGDGLNGGEIVGILAGQVAAGALFLFASGIIHRRYRWRHEREWVLFDWDVLGSPSGPAPLKHYGSAFFSGGWALITMKKRCKSAEPSPQKNCSAMFTEEPARAVKEGLKQGDGEPVTAASLGKFPDLLWEDSIISPEEVSLQQKPDGSLQELGHGSFGKVYKGVLQDVHEVAIKVFEGYVGQREQELLLKEISILRSCRNKNIVQFFGVCIQETDIWMVMELMESNLFRHLARGHHCQWYFRGRRIALDIARGMHYLHSRGIIHMDLKSPNILLSSNGTAKIADVGLARVMGNESIATQVGAGTIHWMAPEVLIDGQCTEKADIFSFGIILWEICTGESPSRGRMTTVSVPEDCPQEVADLMERCIDEDEAKRPCAADIIHAINSFPVTQKPVPQPPWYAR